MGGNSKKQPSYGQEGGETIFLVLCSQRYIEGSLAWNVRRVNVAIGRTGESALVLCRLIVRRTEELFELPHVCVKSGAGVAIDQPIPV